MGEGGIRDLPTPKAPAPPATLADAGSAPGQDWAPGHDGASEDTPGEESAEGSGVPGAPGGVTHGGRDFRPAKGSLGRGCESRRKRAGKGAPDRRDGMCRGPRRSVTPVRRTARVGAMALCTGEAGGLGAVPPEGPTRCVS